MPNHFKLWQRRTEPKNNYSSELFEMCGVNGPGQDQETLICLPGYSTTHDYHREINGYMGIAQNLLGGRGMRANLISVSYRDTKAEAVNINALNDDPLHYTTAAAREFAREVMLPLLREGRNVNILAKSYGACFFQMSMNALAEEEKKAHASHTPDQIRFVCHGNIRRLSHATRNDATEIYIEGTQDEKAARLNAYKESPPSGHKKLTLIPLAPNVLKIHLDVPDTSRHWDIMQHTNGNGKPKPQKIEEVMRVTHDPERHTTRLYTNNGSHDGPNILSRVLRNMLTLKGDAYTIESAVQPAASLVPLYHDIPYPGMLEAPVSARFQEALKRGMQTRALKAVLFDWDLTIADGEKATLNALQKTFRQMMEEGAPAVDISHIDVSNLRSFFRGTAQAYFNKEYNGDTEVESETSRRAVALLNRYRAEARDQVKLIPGAKELMLSLIAKGIKVGIVSNKTQEELMALKDMLLPEPAFENMVVIGNKQGLKAKPRPDPIYAAMTEMGIQQDQAASVMYVGDEFRSDVTASLAAGCKACLVGSGSKKELFERSPRQIEGSENADHALLLNEQNRRILFVYDLPTLSKQIDIMLKENAKITSFYERSRGGISLGQ